MSFALVLQSEDCLCFRKSVKLPLAHPNFHMILRAFRMYELLQKSQILKNWQDKLLKSQEISHILFLCQSTLMEPKDRRKRLHQQGRGRDFESYSLFHLLWACV